MSEREKIVECMARAVNPECWDQILTPTYDDLWMRDAREKERRKARAALSPSNNKKDDECRNS